MRGSYIEPGDHIRYYCNPHWHEGYGLTLVVIGATIIVAVYWFMVSGETITQGLVF